MSAEPKDSSTTPGNAPAGAVASQLVEVARIADAIPHIVWTSDADGRPTYFNAKWTEYSGLDLEGTLRVGAATTVHPDDLGELQRVMREGRASGLEHEATYRLRRASDGAFRWHVARVLPLVSEGGRVTTWVATATDIDEQRTRDHEQRHLVAASAVLGTSLDLRETLTDVAKLIVPEMADWCTIDLLDERGGIERQAVAHVDPSKVALGWELWKLLPPKPEDPTGVFAVLRSGVAEVMPVIPDELLAAAIPDPKILAVVRSLGLRSAMTVPLLVRGRGIGAMTLVTAESTTIYGEAHLAFATELARRVAVAVDNARLYGAAEQARSAAEALAADVIEQSRAVEQALIAMRAERDAAIERAASAAGKT